ncbi:hypothetical protein AMAG_01703 [Allomyces macrogynus ATCC 38327]|uniref:Cytidyltransferase-like domain-containing protein n=1 Tax=Allomyces macrogynus (strain ATCC 38327) TaxID=578462 RepID=A0A0L0S091_ALLM3|nr:hypothetical protein AMAG_01703 [Allomyces macrogynus ATCC 38327]|eukprot:KNE55835.1 hypothetical protein AMAG_01703 [Allomyces macrogynus ATCC 38327]
MAPVSPQLAASVPLHGRALVVVRRPEDARALLPSLDARAAALTRIDVYFAPREPFASVDDTARALARIYVELAALAIAHDRLDLQVNVLVAPRCVSLDTLLQSPDLCVVVSFDEDGTPRVESLPTLEPLTAAALLGGPDSAPPLPNPTHGTVAVGGTFDHLHPGHKALLTATVLHAEHDLVVGLVDDALLVNKKHASVLEPYEMRHAQLVSFLQLLAPNLAVEVVPLRDAFGPAATYANLDALVATVETRDNSEKVNSIRAGNGLDPIDIVLIPVLSGTSDQEMDMANKLSSTQIRAWYVAKALAASAPPADGVTGLDQ